MRDATRATWMVAVAGICAVAGACRSDDSPPTTTAPPASTPVTAIATGPTIDIVDPGSVSVPSGELVPPSIAGSDGTVGDVEVGGTTPDRQAAAMTVTIEIDPRAVWQDGRPITADDFECTWRANTNTPGSITTAGYDLVSDVSAGDNVQQVVVELRSVYSPYKMLFNPLLQAASIANCDDASAEFAAQQPVSARAYELESWSASGSALVPNAVHWGDDEPLTPRIVMVPQADQATEIGALASGQVDFIYPRLDESLAPLLADPNIRVEPADGGDYEALYFQQLEGPLADPVFRQAFSMSIDRDALFAQIYAPLLASIGAQGEVLNCGPIVAGPYCPDDNFADTFDLAAADALLTGAGWAKDDAGFWAKDGEVPTIVWMVNEGDARRERTQAYLIPLLARAGFDVVPDNCDAACVFQQRLPALDYDLAMYTLTARPDPTYLTPLFTCEEIPTERNDFKGRNWQGWCDEEASAALHQADAALDQDDRTGLVQSALRAMDDDHVLLPLINYPRVGAWRTDRLAGPVAAELSNDRAFDNISAWQDIDGDGQIVIGAEQWPTCLNPVTACSQPLWYRWTVGDRTLPGVWDTTAEQTFETTDLVLGEPTVDVAE